MKPKGTRPAAYAVARGIALSFSMLIIVNLLVIPSIAFPKQDNTAAGPLIVEIPAPAADVIEAVKAVCDDNIIHGTYVYEKERTLRGAKAANQSSAFHPWAEGGDIFYKVAENVLAPAHFVDSNGLGKITVRYVVQSTGPQTTSLRIESVFVEDSRRHSDKSQGSVEAAEYQEIRQRLETLQSKRRQEQDELARQKQDDSTRRAESEKRAERARKDMEEESSLEELQKRVEDLRHRAEVHPKSDGVPLKAAPYRSAATLQSLPAKAEMVVLIVTPYWYGVQTQDGHNGWVRRSELESLP